MKVPAPYPLPIPEETTRNGFRWTPKRKLAVVEAVIQHRLDYQLALNAYNLSPEELDEWIRLAHLDGARALRTTRAQIYRK